METKGSDAQNTLGSHTNESARINPSQCEHMRISMTTSEITSKVSATSMLTDEYKIHIDSPHLFAF